MTKSEAIRLLGGTAKEAARRIGITQAAVSQWPEQLTGRHRDRVQAALYRAAVEQKAKRDARRAF